MADSSDMLSIYFNVATVLLASSLEHTEMLYDEYTALFAEIVTKAQQLIQSSEDPSNSSRFTLDMGTILPLMVTATKCRDRRIYGGKQLHLHYMVKGTPRRALLRHNYSRASLRLAIKH